MRTEAPASADTASSSSRPASASGDAWTVGRLLAWTSDHFARRGLDEARLSAEILLGHALSCPRISLYTRFDTVPADDALSRFRGFVKRAAEHEPIAHLVGVKEFYSLDFAVDSRVLVPRPETEVLVECAVDHLASLPEGRDPVVLDLGTGSGCIAIALAKQVGSVRVVATDVSADALEVARENAERHGAMERIEFVEADELALPTEFIPDGGFDLILSNPPYISESDHAALEQHVREYEPRLALTDGGDGLSFYRAIGCGAAPLLADGGLVMVEIGDGAGDAVADALGASLVEKRRVRDRTVGVERVMVFGAA